MRRPTKRSLTGLFLEADATPEDSEEESGMPSRYKDSDEEWPGAFMRLCAWKERLKDIASCVAGCSLKSVE